MNEAFARRLKGLIGARCTSVDGEEYETPPSDSIYAVGTVLRFSDGSRLAAQFWRLIKARRPRISSFDHHQRYGFPLPIDAINVLRSEVVDRMVSNASMRPDTADLVFDFTNDITLEVFNFTGFEIWELIFPDGTGELSNYALGESRR